MARLQSEVRKHLARTTLVVLPEDYFIINLPPDAKPIPGEWYRPATTRFGVLIRETKEITLVIPRRKWLRMQNLFTKFSAHGPSKVITFDTEASLQLYGFIAAISSVLAQEKISILPIAGFKRAHILVDKAELPRAIRLLRQFLKGLGGQA